MVIFQKLVDWLDWLRPVSASIQNSSQDIFVSLIFIFYYKLCFLNTKPLSEVASILLVIQIQIQAVWCITSPLPKSRTTKLDGPHSEGTCQIWIIKPRPNSWDPNYTPGVDFLDHNFLSSKNLGYDLSNEGSNLILSSLVVGHWVAQT